MSCSYNNREDKRSSTKFNRLTQTTAYSCGINCLCRFTTMKSRSNFDQYQYKKYVLGERIRLPTIIGIPSWWKK